MPGDGTWPNGCAFTADTGAAGEAGSNVLTVEGGRRPPGGDYARIVTHTRYNQAFSLCPTCRGMDIEAEVTLSTGETYSFTLQWYKSLADWQCRNPAPSEPTTWFCEPPVNAEAAPFWAAGFGPGLPIGETENNLCSSTFGCRGLIAQCATTGEGDSVRCCWSLGLLTAPYPTTMAGDPEDGCYSGFDWVSSCFEKKPENELDGKCLTFTEQSLFLLPNPEDPFGPPIPGPPRTATACFTGKFCEGDPDPCDFTDPVGEFWNYCLPAYPWCRTERQAYLSSPEKDFAGGPFPIARAPCCPGLDCGEAPDPECDQEEQQAANEAFARAQAEAACNCTPHWCGLFQDQDVNGDPVGGKYWGWSTYAEEDAAVGLVLEDLPVEIRRLAKVYQAASRYNVIPEELKIPGKPIKRSFEIVSGPWQTRTYLCDSCPPCGHPADDWFHCHCGLEPVLEECLWPLDEPGEPPEGYDPSLCLAQRLEQWNECKGDRQEERANRSATEPVVGASGYENIDKTGSYIFGPPGTPPDWLWKLPVWFWITNSGNAAAPLAVTKTENMTFVAALRDKIEGPAVERLEVPEGTLYCDLAAFFEAEELAGRDARAAAEDAFQADLEASLESYRDGPWWCVEYVEKDSEGNPVGPPYRGCAEIRYAPGSGGAAASAGDAEDVELGPEGPHFPGAVGRTRTIVGQRYHIGAGENNPLARCEQSCPSCGTAADPVYDPTRPPPPPPVMMTAMAAPPESPEAAPGGPAVAVATARPVDPGLAAKARERVSLMQAKALACRHRGGPTGDTRLCSRCGGGVLAPVHACVLHGECTVDKYATGTRCCLICPDRSPA